MAQGRAMRVPKGEGLLVGTSHLRGFPGGAGSKASGLRAHGGPGVGSGWLGGTQGLWQELLWGGVAWPCRPAGTSWRTAGSEGAEARCPASSPAIVPAVGCHEADASGARSTRCPRTVRGLLGCGPGVQLPPL